MPREPSTSRPVTWPSTSMCGFDTAAHEPPRHRARAPCAAWNAPRRRRCRARRAARAPGRARRPRGCRPRCPDSSVKPSPLIPATTLELLAQPLRREAVGDAQPRRVVGEREVLVAERPGGLDHQVDRGQSVGPVAVACRSPRSRPAASSAFSTPARSRRSARYAGTSPRQRLLDHGEGRVADALAAAQGCGIPQLVRRSGPRSRPPRPGRPSTCTATIARARAASRSR